MEPVKKELVQQKKEQISAKIATQKEPVKAVAKQDQTYRPAKKQDSYDVNEVVTGSEKPEGFRPIMFFFWFMGILLLLLLLLLVFRYRVIEHTVSEEKDKVLYRSFSLRRICQFITEYEFDDAPADFICLKIEGIFRKNRLLYWNDGDNKNCVFATEDEKEILQEYDLLDFEEMSESEIQMQLVSGSID